MSESMSLVYGYIEFPQGFAILPEKLAVERAEEVQALSSARTWGEARAVKVRHTMDLLEEGYVWDVDAQDDAPFDLGAFDPVAEGDWPGMPSQYIVDYERELTEQLKQVGSIRDTTHNGEYLEILLEDEQRMVDVLRANGYTVRRDDLLVVATYYQKEDVDRVRGLIESGEYPPEYLAWER